ncbi:MAG: hypothetical protein ACEPOZ_15135 [Marinifilaceae bacterium]|jgi:DNA mismatch repair ATPase MutS
MNNKLHYYKNRIENLEQNLRSLKHRNRYLSFFRLISALAAIILFYIFLGQSVLLATGLFLIFLVALILLISAYNRNERKIKEFNTLITICKNEIHCLTTRHNPLFSDGNDYLQPHHPYASDLDIFGPHSLFQLSNRCVTKTGNNTLSEWLSSPATNDNIMKRQIAVKELSKITDWRQNIIRYGLSLKLKNDDPEFLINWGSTPSPFHKNKILYYSIFVLPVLSSLALVYSFIGSAIPISALVMIHIGIHYLNFRKVNRAHDHTSKRGNMLKTYSYIIKQFETQNWNSKKLKQLQEQLASNDRPTSQKIHQLTRLIELLDQRFNMVVQILFNLLFFYELHLLFRIDKWKQNYGKDIEKWFGVIGEIEALSSFANLSFNHEDWCFPSLSNQHFEMDMNEAGHPMIDHNLRVCNDYHLKGPGTVHIITGSNMAGKSTFLRTIGVNVVLALAGAPVCAREMNVSNVEVNTSMRIKDSIEDNESSFYAELKRIQQVIEKVNKKENTLLLLDEILRGTNSKDKHTGSKALIKQLVKYDAVALVATHDLELSVLENELPGNVENRFFDIQIDKDQLYFDYKIQHGVCKTFNAPILMKKMGIDLDILTESH